MYFVSHSDVIAVADYPDTFHKQRQGRAVLACSIRRVVLDFLSPGNEERGRCHVCQYGYLLAYDSEENGAVHPGWL